MPAFRAISKESGGVSRYDATRCHVARDNGAGTNYSILANPKARQNDCARADKRVFADFHFTRENGAGSDMRAHGDATVVIDRSAGVDDDCVAQECAGADG